MKFDSKDNIYVSYSDTLLPLFEGKCKLIKSTDNGETWIDLTGNLPFSFKFFDIAYEDVDVIYATSIYSDKLCYSIDRGANWEVVVTDIINFGVGSSVEIFAIALNGFLFMKVYDEQYQKPQALLRSENGGRTWIKIISEIENLYVRGLTFGKNGEVLVATTATSVDRKDNLFFSQNYGDSFQLVRTNIRQIYCNFTLFHITNEFLYFTDGTGINRSSDKGTNWEFISEGLYFRSPKTILSNSKGELFIAHEYGISKSDDKGETWYDAFTNIKDYDEISFMTINNQDRLYYVNYLDMIYYSAEPTPVESLSDGDNYKDAVISPNPASDFINITVGTRHAESLQPGIDRRVNPTVDDAAYIRIYDIYGELVMTVGQTPPSDQTNLTHEQDNPTLALSLQKGGIRIDVSGLAPGVYFVQVSCVTVNFIKL
ncbi:MAG: hypothetical protein QG635_2271 [Bacteroidota bacterium]|nr:hypothetical protein [Bacteroidota bacterium]